MRVGIFIIVLSFLVAVMVAGKSISLAEEEAIGYIRKVERPAFVVRHELRRTASIGYSIFMDDLLTTGKTGAMGITFKDNTMISIGTDTEFVVDEFVYQPRENALSFVSKMMRGTLHFVSGPIYSAEIKTKVARPFFLCGISAGFPSPADDYIDRMLDLSNFRLSYCIHRISGGQKLLAGP